MNPHYADPLVTLYLGDCIEVMAGMDADSVDAVVTDPPYGLEFMGKEWDRFVPAKRRRPEWDGRRRNDAGAKWEGSVRDRGDGKPGGPSFSVDAHYKPNTKCRTCGKWQFDKNRCRCEKPDWEYRIRKEAPTQLLAFQQWCHAWATEALRVTKPGGYLLAFGGTRTHHRLVCALEDAGWIIRDELDWIYASGFPKGKANLKPAHEPIVLARKPGPLRPLAIDDCRIGTNGEVIAAPSASGAVVGGHQGQEGYDRPWKHDEEAVARRVERAAEDVEIANRLGRWPSNVLLSDPALFDEPNPDVVGSGAVTGPSEGLKAKAGTVKFSPDGPLGNGNHPPSLEDQEGGYGDSGGYSRFFIVPKADRAERDRGLADRPAFEGADPMAGHRGRRMDGDVKVRPDGKVSAPRANTHPTVKPLALMSHLVKLVTPTDGVVLDCFLGSGTTCLAASELGIRSIGIEREAEYLEIAKGRLLATPMGLGLDTDLVQPAAKSSWFHGRDGMKDDAA